MHLKDLKVQQNNKRPVFYSILAPLILHTRVCMHGSDGKFAKFAVGSLVGSLLTALCGACTKAKTVSYLQSGNCVTVAPYQYLKLQFLTKLIN